ncbi:MAG: hypothetical protein MK324_08970 [Pirellulales bacterium]|jgi:hypothetical protein|nr:hypothetical protein [Pirellulales bacterium]
MFRAFVLGLSVSLLLVGLEGLAIESVVIAFPELLHGSSHPPMHVQVTDLAAWLTIGLGTSLTLYTIFTGRAKGKPSLEKSLPADTSSTPLQLANLNYEDLVETDSSELVEETDREENVSDFGKDEEEYEYEEEDDGYDDRDSEDREEEEEDDSIDDFDLDTFNAEFDIDDLLSE